MVGGGWVDFGRNVSEMMETCKESEFSAERRNDCSHYWFIGTKKELAKGGMMLLGQSALRQLKMCLQRMSMYEVFQQLYWRKSTTYEIS